MTNDLDDMDTGDNETGETETGTQARRTVMSLADIRQITPPQLAALGVSQIAYVKPVQMNGAPAFAIHAADGTPMAVAGEQNLAIAAIIQHEMMPALVH
jgi:hypothetical protein